MNRTEITKELKILIQSTHPLIGIETVEEEIVTHYLKALSEEMTIEFFEWSTVRGLEATKGTYATRNTDDPLVCSKFMRDFAGTAVFLLKDFTSHLQTPLHIRMFREACQSLSKRKSSAIMIGSGLQLPKEIQHRAVVLDWPLPDQDEVKQLINKTFEKLNSVKPSVKFEIKKEDHLSLLNSLSGLTRAQVEDALTSSFVSEASLNANDLQTLLDRKAKVLKSGVQLEYIPPHKITSDLGGFKNLKKWLDRTQIAFTPEAKKRGVPLPKGILFVGVPGCGKSLAVRVIAAQWKMPLLKLDPSLLLDKYIGESEKNFRSAVKIAENMAPFILCIDEIEKAMEAQGGSSGDSGVGKRLFGAFLTWLQEKQSMVYVMATANNLDILPPELLRKGRFDEIFFVDLPNDIERDTILKLHFNRRTVDSSKIDFPKLVQATAKFSGAELEHVVINLILENLSTQVPMTTDLAIQECKKIIPLAVARSEDIENLRTSASMQFTKVS